LRGAGGGGRGCSGLAWRLAAVERGGRWRNRVVVVATGWQPGNVAGIGGGRWRLGPMWRCGGWGRPRQAAYGGRRRIATASEEGGGVISSIGSATRVGRYGSWLCALVPCLACAMKALLPSVSVRMLGRTLAFIIRSGTA